MFRWIVPALLVFFVSGCGPFTSVHPGDLLPNQQIKEYKGTVYLISRDDKSVAIAGVVNSPCPAGMRLRVELLVENLANEPVDFLFHEITASYNGIPLKVFSYSELVQEVYAHRNNLRIPLRMKRLGDDDGSGLYQMMYDDRNYPPGNLNSETGEYFGNPSEESNAKIRKTESGFIQSAMYIDDFDLNKLTKESLGNKILTKKSPYRGIVVVENPELDDMVGKGGHIILSVSVGKKIHRFMFDVSRLANK